MCGIKLVILLPITGHLVFRNKWLQSEGVPSGQINDMELTYWKAELPQRACTRTVSMQYRYKTTTGLSVVGRPSIRKFLLSA